MRGGRTRISGLTALSISALTLAIAACGETKREDPAPTAAETGAATTTAEAPAAPAPAAAPPVANVDTTDGTKLASFTGDAAKGKIAFLTCGTCHAVQAGVNKIGPSLAGIVGRKAGEVAGYSYTPANKNSGITWTREKLFQYLENPARIVPGTKMAFAGFPEAQKRADVIAYLENPS